MIRFIQSLWQRTNARKNNSHSDFWTWRLTPVGFFNWNCLLPFLKKYVKGSTLDAGAGTLLFKKVISQYSASYVSTDKYSVHSELDYQYDIKDLKFPCESFDTVFCNQVLEHVDDPYQALKEMTRVLKKDGMLILGTPFYYYLHGLPYDYFRFTEQGLKKIVCDHGFEIVEIQSAGGYFSALIEPMNILFTCLGLSIPVWKNLINTINYIFLVLPFVLLDKILQTNRWYPSIYILAAIKK